MAEICLRSALVDEADQDYRYSVRGGCTAARRRRTADSLPRDADLQGAYRSAVEPWAS
jgi:hypothetical protein